MSTPRFIEHVVPQTTLLASPYTATSSQFLISSRVALEGAGRPIEPSHTNGRLLKATPDTPGNQDPTTGPNTPGAKR